ncbi:MAG: hypothetical protein HOK41_15595 [Nitrospina sp.]|jgi:hypothetical protein|nr:hypothetical protein [Nitrospina sp.]
MRVINIEDPDRISVLLPKPGVIPKYSSKAKEENSELLRNIRMPQKEIICSRAGDAIEAWMKLEKASLEKPQSENTYYLCSGTKPHSLALGLRALCLGFPTVLYNVPEKHRVIDVEPSGAFWLYSIKDLSALT